MRQGLFIGLCMLLSPSLHAQKEIQFAYTSEQLMEEYEISTLRFYVSNIQLKSTDGYWYSDQVDAHLIDMKVPNSWTIPLADCPKNMDVDSVAFLLGTDSLMNVSGILDGDLDPIKGMYWSWNSGYINVKVEGKERATNTAFEYHLGGYLPPFSTARKIRLKTSTSNSLRISVDVSRFLKSARIEEKSEVLIPGPEASELSSHFSTCFSVD